MFVTSWRENSRLKQVSVSLKEAIPVLGPDAVSLAYTLVQTVWRTFQALWPCGGWWTQGADQGQDLTLVLTEITSRNSLQPQSPHLMMEMMQVSMAQGCGTSQASS